MKEGDVILASLLGADGTAKNRPALVLRMLPGFGDFLVCGISTQLRDAIPDFDEILRQSDQDFPASGLVADSVIRLGFLAVLSRRRIMGSIGTVAPERHHRLLRRLSEYIAQREHC